MPGDRLFTQRFFVMCGFTFTVFVSGFMLFPSAPFHVLDFGGTKFTAGLFLGFFTYASAWSAPFTGALADRLGKRRMLVIASASLIGVCFLYAASPNYVLLLTVAPFHGLFWSALMTASAAYLVDHIPESRRAEGLSYWGISIIAAIAVAPPLAFWIFRFGWFWICAGSALANLTMAAIALSLPNGPDGKHGPRPEEARRTGLIEWRVLGVSLTLFLFTFGYGGITSFVALYAEANGVSRGLYFTVLALVILITRPLLGRLADRIGHKLVLLPCLALTAMGLGLLVPGGALVWLLASAVVFGLGFGSAFPVYSAYIMQHVATARRGAAFGAMLAAFDTGIGTGSIAMGYVIEIADFGTAYGIAAALAALAVPFFVLTERNLLRGEWR
ncbi:MAG: MFS transporter [Vicinamibacteria bacterium]